MLILLFIRISYLLKVFRVDSGILRDSFAVPLLKTLSQLPQSVAFYALFCFTRLLANFPFRAFVLMISWASTEVLLNLIARLDSAVLSIDFERINIFWTSGFDSVSILFDSSIVGMRKGWWMIKCINILIKSSLNFNVVFVNGLALRTVSYTWENIGKNL